jgi:ABC-2 type transport system ATP-binding protein
VIALMNKPDLLMLDEPSSGLDPLMQQTFNELMLEVQKEGRTVFLSSHILSEVQAICDRVAILRDGQLKAVERVTDLTHADFRWVTLRLRESITPAQLATVKGVSDISQVEDGLRLRLIGDFDPLLRAIDTYYVHDIQVQEPTLEEIFLTFYGNNGQVQTPARSTEVAS